ncbi:exoribonuclease II [Salmonella enterica subsp. enterica serovar Kentucky str. 29439]|nr:exoribonuclease II [Salmonella enterica subsp. enterica serovar Kentucky str. 29439]
MVCVCDWSITALSPLSLPPFLHAVRDELVCSQENGTVQIKGETVYKVTDVIDVTIAEVRMETRSIIARPAA